MESDINSLISISLVGGKYFVWEGDDIFTLRNKHRVCGQLVGSLPWKPWQSSIHSSPLMLLPCEAHYCHKNGIAQLVEGKDYFSKRQICSEDVMKFNEKRLGIEKDQIKIFKAEREAKKKLFFGRNKKAWKKKKKDMMEPGSDLCDDELSNVTEFDAHEDSAEVESLIAISEVKTEIGSCYNDGTSEELTCLEGINKADTLISVLNNEPEINSTVEHREVDSHSQKSETIVDTEFSHLNNLPCKNTSESRYTESTEIDWEDIVLSEEDIRYYNGSVRVHIPTNVVEENSFEEFLKHFPMTEKEKCCCVVYEDMHKRGYYLTSALKFGGDFLVYLGDPLRHHSHYIILVLERNHLLTVKEMITYGRLAAAVKKTVVLATLKEDYSCVEYLSLTWAQMK